MATDNFGPKMLKNEKANNLSMFFLFFIHKLIYMCVCVCIIDFTNDSEQPQIQNAHISRIRSVQEVKGSSLSQVFPIRY